MNQSDQFVLASGSPRRKMLLESEGYRFRIEKPEVEEWDQSTHPELTFLEIASLNAERKALAITEQNPQDWVLAADTVVLCEGKLLGKPADQQEAHKMLSWLSGKTHEVLTSVAWINASQKECQKHHARTHVTFRTLSPQQITDYIEQVPVLDKAGAYALQDRGEDIVERVEGSRTNVIGLPMEIIAQWCSPFKA